MLTLKEYGHDLSVTARSMDALQMDVLDKLDVDISVGDLRDPRTLSSLRRPIDAIIHAAARYTAPAGDFTALVEDNIVATQAVLAFAKSGSCKQLIALSTVSVHGNVPTSTLSWESGYLNPSAYGISKRVSELILADAWAHMPVAIIRLPGVIGLGAHRHWLAGIVGRSIRGEPIEIAGPMNLFNNTVHLEDLCHFLAKIVGNAAQSSEPFPIASTHPLTISEIATIIVRETGNKSEIVEKSASRAHFVIDDAFARQILGYESMSTTEAIITYVRSEFTAAYPDGILPSIERDVGFHAKGLDL